MHAHHAMHFMLAIEGELRVCDSPGGKWWSAAGVLTSPDAPHAIDAEGIEILLVFLDPESDTAATFLGAFEEPIRLLSDKERGGLVRDVVPRQILRFGSAEWVRKAARQLRLASPPLRRTLHPRIRQLLRVLRARGVDESTSLDALARAVGLSPSRLMHVFTESIGIPLRPYLGWLRVQRAAMSIVSGSSLTDAAHLAGFSDAAHMSRTFRRMLGTAPSLLRPMRCSA
jgi:AraC-like DNA-binding protein